MRYEESPWPIQLPEMQRSFRLLRVGMSSTYWKIELWNSFYANGYAEIDFDAKIIKASVSYHSDTQYDDTLFAEHAMKDPLNPPAMAKQAGEAGTQGGAFKYWIAA